MKDNPMQYSFFALLFRQRYIGRWSLMHSTEQETLAQHSMECAVLSHCLCEIGNTFFGGSYDSSYAALLGLFHDSPEVITGDLPTPIKYASEEMRTTYGMIEDKAVQRMLSKLPDELKGTYSALLRPESGNETKIVKAADKLCALIKCSNERRSGNREFDAAYAATKAELEKMDLPEANWFMENMLSSFELPIDEL